MKAFPDFEKHKRKQYKSNNINLLEEQFEIYYSLELFLKRN